MQGCQHWRWKSEKNHRLHYWRNNLWRNQVFIQNNFLTFELKYPPILLYGNLNTRRVLYSNGISASECKMAPNLSGIWILYRYFNNENERTERIENFEQKLVKSFLEVPAGLSGWGFHHHQAGSMVVQKTLPIVNSFYNSIFSSFHTYLFG